ncbi:hypothetical protein EMIT0111MI5_11091 [Burkholderia sp. IT-111MI5]
MAASTQKIQNAAVTAALTHPELVGARLRSDGLRPHKETAVPTGNLRLYADARCTSPYAMSVFVAFEEKSLPYELVTVDLGNRPPL